MGDSPAVIGGRGLKPRSLAGQAGGAADSPAVIGGRGLKQDHEGWLRDPQNKVNDWETRSAAYRAGLLKKWRQDIARHREQTAILKGVLKEKGYGE